MKKDLVLELNKRHTCEWSAAISDILKLDGKQAVDIVVQAIEQRPIGLRPHQIALEYISLKDAGAVLALLEHETKDVRKSAISALEKFIQQVKSTHLSNLRKVIVESSASYESEDARKSAVDLLDAIDERKRRITDSARDSFLGRVPHASVKQKDGKPISKRTIKQT